jgi:NADP-dependent 3-hydroxy acid dehydrogenase YdfG
VVLNAGLLGQIQSMQDADIAELRQLMDLNVWAHKPILRSFRGQHPYYAEEKKGTEELNLNPSAPFLRG